MIHVDKHCLVPLVPFFIIALSMDPYSLSEPRKERRVTSAAFYYSPVVIDLLVIRSWSTFLVTLCTSGNIHFRKSLSLSVKSQGISEKKIEIFSWTSFV